MSILYHIMYKTEKNKIKKRRQIVENIIEIENNDHCI